jgi:hypothetical protein
MSVKLTLMLVIFASVWLSLPVTHWSGYSSSSVLTTGVGVAMATWLPVVPTALFAWLAVGGTRNREAWRWWVALVIVLVAIPMVLLSQLYFPFFVPGLVGAVTSLVLLRPRREWSLNDY